MHFDLGDGYSLRSFLYGDAQSLARHGNNPKIARNLRDSFPNPYTVEHARVWIQHVKENESKTRFVITNQRNEAIGEIGFVVQMDVHRYTAEIGYWLSEDHWGKGVMSRAVASVADYAFNKMGLVRLFADVQEQNESSCRVLSKCGFKLEGVFHKHIFKEGEHTNQFVYALVRDDS